MYILLSMGEILLKNFKSFFVILILTVTTLVGCNSQEDLYQESIGKSLAFLEKNDWENAEKEIKEVPNGFSLDVEPLKVFIQANIEMNSGNFKDEFQKNRMVLGYFNKIELKGVNKELKNKINKLKNDLQSKIDNEIKIAEVEEKKHVIASYNMLEEYRTTISDDAKERELLLNITVNMRDYDLYKSSYKVDAHILYLYAMNSLLIKNYRENMDGNGYNGIGTYDNYDTYGQTFADKNKVAIVKHLIDLDPLNKGVFLPPHVLDNLKIGLNNFFDITEQDWIQIYNDKEKDWVGEVVNEGKINTKLRESIPQVGMTKDEVINTKWGRPEDINRTVTSYGTSEQWVYPDYRYVYLEDGIVTGVQD